MKRRRDPADYNELVDVERRAADNRNDFGEANPTEDWELCDSIWGDVQTKGAQAQWRSGSEIVEATHLVSTHWSEIVAAVLPQTYRLVWNDRILSVIYVEDVGNRHQHIDIVCQEIVGAVDDFAEEA